MPTTITAQDGATITQATPIALTGCGNVLASKARKPTRAQLLAKALKACRSTYEHSRHKRQTCEKQARKKYGPSTKRKTGKTTHDGHKAQTARRQTTRRG